MKQKIINIIDLTNFETYENKYDEYHKTYEILVEIKNLMKYIKTNIFYLDLEGMHYKYVDAKKEYNKLNITNFDTSVDKETLLSHKKKFEDIKKNNDKIKKRISKRKKRKTRKGRK